MYLRDKNGWTVGCVAMLLQSKERQVGFQLSVVNPADKFERVLARQLALGRLVEQPYFVSLPRQYNAHDISEAVMVAIRNNSALPTRAREAARRWLRVNSL